MTDFQFYLNRQGIKGRKGDTGDAGFSPIISVKTATANEYILNIQNEGSSFETPNLRGNAIENQGGTYIRYNPTSSAMYTGYADIASTSQYGEVILSNYSSLEAGGSENTVPNSQDVYNFVINKIAEETFDFSKLAQSLVEGQNITFNVDNTNKTITINADIEVGDYVTEGELTETLEDYATIASVETDLAEKQDIITAHAPLYFDEAPASISNYTYNNNTDTYDLDSSSGTVQFSGKYNSSSTVEVTYNNAANLAVITVPYEYGQIFRLFKGYSEEPAARQRMASGFGYIYNSFPIYTIGNVDFPSSTSWRHRCQVVDDSLIRTAIDGYSGSADLSVGDVSTTNVASITENSEIYGQLLYDEQSDIYTINLYDKYSGAKYQAQFGFNDSQYSTLSRIDKYIITIDASLPKSKGAYYAGTDIDLYTISVDDFDNLSFSNIFTNSGSTSQGTELYINTSDFASTQSLNDLTDDVSDIRAILDDKANADLGNLDSNGEEKLHALKGYLEEVEPLTNSEGYNDLAKGLNTTFNSTNFTATNSATITSDGIASNWGRVTSPEVITSTVSTFVTLSMSKIFVLEMDWVYKTSSNFETVFATNLYAGGEGSRIIRLGKNSSGDLVVFYPTAAGLRLNNSEYSPTNNETLKIKFTYNPTTSTDNIILQVTKADGTTYTRTQSSSMLVDGITAVYWGSNSSGQEGYQGTIDLKYVKITNGSDVISGNKTGVDTIKPDDYTVVGSPTISADGIASGFSDSDYLTAISLNLYQKTSFKISFKFTTSSDFSQLQRIYDRSIGGVDFANFEIKTDKTCNSIIYANGAMVSLTTSVNTALENNTNYLVTIEYSNSQYKVKCTKVDTNTDVYIAASTTTTNDIRNVDVSYYIGRGYNSDNYFTGSIDLNSFKIYVDGDLVYQACLKIPYTESIYGDRIADIQYLPRVQDTFNQTGNCDEAVIDTENQVYYLPAGNIYGKFNRSLGDISTILDSINGEGV